MLECLRHCIDNAQEELIMQKTIRQCWQHRAVFALLSLDCRLAATSFCGFSRWQPWRARHKQNDTNQILQVLNTESFQENSKHQIASFNRHKKDECSTCKESGVVVIEKHHVHALLSRVFESSAGVLVICHRQCATPSSLHRALKTQHWKPNIAFQLLENQWWKGKFDTLE